MEVIESMLDLFLAHFIPFLGMSLGIAVGAFFAVLGVRIIDEFLI